MIKTALPFVITTLPIFLFGYLFTNLLLKRGAFWEKVFLGFLMSSGLITFFWFVLNLAGIPYTIGSLLALVWSSTVVLLILNLTLRRLSFKKPNLKLALLKIWRLPLWVKILLVYLFVILISSLISDLYWPVRDWDSLVLYDYRAKVFVNTGFMTDGIVRGYFFNYPLLTSLVHTWIYLTGIANPMFYYFLLYLSFIVVFYFGLEKHVPKSIALIGTVFLASIPGIYSHSQMAYTNLPYMIYLVLAYIYFYNWFKYNDNGSLAVSSILLSLSTWTRSSEPFWMIPILVLTVASVLRKKLIPLFMYAVLFFPVQAVWNTFQSNIFGAQYSTTKMVESSVITMLTKFSMTRSLEILDYLYKNVFVSWGLLGVVFVLFSVYAIVRLKKSGILMFSLLVLLSFFALVASTYIFSFGVDTWKEIPDSARRMSIFFLPLFVFSAFSFLGDFWKLSKIREKQ